MKRWSFALPGFNPQMPDPIPPGPVLGSHRRNNEPLICWLAFKVHTSETLLADRAARKYLVFYDSPAVEESQITMLRKAIKKKINDWNEQKISLHDLDSKYSKPIVDFDEWLPKLEGPTSLLNIRKTFR